MKKKEYISSTDESTKKQLSEDIISAQTIAQQKREASRASNEKARELAASGVVSSAGNVPATSTDAKDAASASSTASAASTDSKDTKPTPASSTTPVSNYEAKYTDELKSVENTENLIEKDRCGEAGWIGLKENIHSGW